LFHTLFLWPGGIAMVIIDAKESLESVGQDILQNVRMTLSSRHLEQPLLNLKATRPQ